MSQNNAANAKTGETKNDEQKAGVPLIPATSSSSNNNKTNNKVPQLEPQKLKLVSDTIKRNPKTELAQSDILELVCYLEGELQARDVVIAALRSESIKGHLLAAAQSHNVSVNDPHAALFRDYVASSGNIASKASSALAAKCELESRNNANERLKFLESMVMQQRQTHLQMCKILRNAESKEKQLVNELDEARRKHEHDTAQGDDITYGLELERTRLKQDLEKEREAKKKVEKDLKKLQEQLEREKTREKQLVFFLLVERKKLVLKYIEERKRSEDYALILTEEKLKCDTLAEGLEEESKKSLRMEAELEKQSLAHQRERDTLLANVAAEQQMNREKDLEIKQLREQLDELKRSGKMTGTAKFISSQAKSLSGATIGDDLVATSNPLVKVVQPTSIAISGPVSGPTTGIAKSVVSSQSLRSANQQISSITSKTGASNQPPQPPLKKSAILSSQNTNVVQNVTNSATIIRGNPPPIPPNKPVVPVKRDSNSRIPFVAVNVNSTATPPTGNVVGAVTATDVSHTPMFSSNITK
uniref:CSON002970 protein n=1 Tax=Culicoides sonorensis TaxID=179676 RepID=A0A336MP52_CULSO